MPRESPLHLFLKHPRSDHWWGAAESSSLLIAEARGIGLLPRLASLLSDSPPSPENELLSFQAHFCSALIHASAFQRDVIRELGLIKQALAKVQFPVLLLKGAAYTLMDCGIARGRVFSDIDILVGANQIAIVESYLKAAGWFSANMTPYDERYYREWSHEVPPLTHRNRGTTIDLHHSLVMPTCRVKVDSEAMINDAVPLSVDGFWWRLKDEDLVLHAAAHLLLNGEFDRGLRDLWDIDALLKLFSSKRSDFFVTLKNRADKIGLAEVLADTLYLLKYFFDAPIPSNVPMSGGHIRRLLFRASLGTRHSETKSRFQLISDVLLAVREIYLRLPLKLMMVHLWHKSITAIRDKSNDEIKVLL